MKPAVHHIVYELLYQLGHQRPGTYHTSEVALNHIDAADKARRRCGNVRAMKILGITRPGNGDVVVLFSRKDAHSW